MTRMDDQIQLKGEAYELHRDSGSVEDDYGDVTPIWAKQADEYIWLQKAGRSSLMAQGAEESGRWDPGARIGFLKTTSAAQALDLVVIGSTKYHVEKVDPVTMYGGTTSHLEAHLTLSEEG